MHVVRARNVNDAYALGLDYLRVNGSPQDSRAGRVLVSPTPVTTVYERPRERVLFDPSRDANPFFHLFEALWMLSGSRDATWLDRFVSDFSARFAEPDGEQHGAYGFRWRRYFDLEGGGCPGLPDQLDTLVELLSSDPGDRRTVLAMWDPAGDLGADKRDIPCNTHAYLRIRTVDGGYEYHEDGFAVGLAPSGFVLDLTVCCRSNDAIWGAYGANAVHFSVLQEYLAARIGVDVGRYYQVSNNYHAYEEVSDRVGDPQPVPEYPGMTSLVDDPARWDADLDGFMSWASLSDFWDRPGAWIHNRWFEHTAQPLMLAHHFWRLGQPHDALAALDDAEDMSPDWRRAAREWLVRRIGR